MLGNKPGLFIGSLQFGGKQEVGWGIWNWKLFSDFGKARVDATRQLNKITKLFIFAMHSSILQQDETEYGIKFS